MRIAFLRGFPSLVKGRYVRKKSQLSKIQDENYLFRAEKSAIVRVSEPSRLARLHFFLRGGSFLAFKTRMIVLFSAQETEKENLGGCPRACAS